MVNAAGWQPDPQHHDQDRYWDGAAWTDEVRPAEPGADLGRAPDHVPQLHRALSEAAADLDAVEDRLSTLFERTERPRSASGPGPARPTTSPPEAAGAGGASAGDDEDILDLFEDGEVEEADDDVGFAEPAVADRRAIIGEYEDDIGGDFAELDAELAAEEPDEPARGKRRMLRRRAKGTAAVGDRDA